MTPEERAVLDAVLEWEIPPLNIGGGVRRLAETVRAYRKSLEPADSYHQRYMVATSCKPGVMHEVLDTQVNRVVCYSTNERHCDRIAGHLNAEPPESLEPEPAWSVVASYTADGPWCVRCASSPEHNLWTKHRRWGERIAQLLNQADGTEGASKG